MKTKYLILYSTLLFTFSYQLNKKVEEDEKPEAIRFDREGSPILKGMKVPARTDIYFDIGVLAYLKMRASLLITGNILTKPMSKA